MKICNLEIDCDEPIAWLDLRHNHLIVSILNVLREMSKVSMHS